MDDDKLIIYSDSRETRNGRIAYEKESGDMYCLIPAANEDEGSIRHFYDLPYEALEWAICFILMDSIELLKLRFHLNRLMKCIKSKN